MVHASEQQVQVVVVGKANLDYLVRGPRLPSPGQSVNGEEFQEAPGGKGANQAVGVARLGARALLVARVGRDARGDAALAALLAEGVDCSGVVRDEHAATGVALCQVAENGEKQILSAAGANARLSGDDVRAVGSRLGSTQVLLLQTGVPMGAVEAAVELAQQLRAKVVLDSGPPQPLPGRLLARVDVLRANASEAHALTGIEVRDRDSAREAARALLSRGCGAAVLQAGEHGDLLLAGSADAAPLELWLPRFEVRRIDATGAGDAFSSALAVALAEGEVLADAARFANAAAALATTVLGAQASLPRRPAVLALLAGR